MTASPWAVPLPELSDSDLRTIARLVYEKTGINLREGKRALVTARLQRRLRTGGFRSFRQYIRYVQADETGRELTVMLDALATNHTSFFREPRHFEFLAKTVLPRLAARGGSIRGWSAGCATGEEPYTIAMLLLEQFGPEAWQRAHLVASDLSTKALAAAGAGVYKRGRLQDVPAAFAQKYFVGDPEHPRDLVHVDPDLRRLIGFRRLNLLQPDTSVLPPQDFIFCRNVMIYFDRDAQQRVIEGLESRLVRGGYLFISHSESLSSLAHGLTWVAPAVYQRVAG